MVVLKSQLEVSYGGLRDQGRMLEAMFDSKESNMWPRFEKFFKIEVTLNMKSTAFSLWSLKGHRRRSGRRHRQPARCNHSLASHILQRKRLVQQSVY